VAVAPIIRTCSTALALLIAAPAFAQTDAASYVRARAADAKGAAQAAAAGYARALAVAPNDLTLALRAYRQGLAAGDYVLARRAGAILTAAKVAPPDVVLLDFAAAVQGRDKAGARLVLQRIASGPFDFLAPVLGAWLAFDRGEDPAPLLATARGNSLASRYADQHAALLLIAGKRFDQAMLALAPLLNGGTGDDIDLRIDAATLFQRVGAKDRARQLLDRPGAELAATARGKADMAFGISRLFVSLAGDVAAQDMSPLSILLSRCALLLDPKEDRARIYLADALSRSGSDTLALSTLDQVPADSPFIRSAVAARVATLRRAGRTAEALADARALAEATGGTSADAQAYGDVLAAGGNYGGAADAYATAVARAGEGAGWKLFLAHGAALDRAGRWQEALPALKRAVELAPDEASTLEYLGYAQVERGDDLAGASAILERARALKPKDASIADALGWAYLRRGDLSRALPLLEQAARSDPGGTLANEHLGDAYWQLGRRYEARYAWRAAAIYADKETAKRLQDKLTQGL
jgi:tetratricopeptide (TPR) repeat protein